jgi:TonB family protein
VGGPASGSSGQPTLAAIGGGGARNAGSGTGPAPAPSRGTSQGGGPAGGGPTAGGMATPNVGSGSRGGPGSKNGSRGNGEQQGNPDDGPGREPSVAARKDVDWGPYMADLQRRIKRAWYPPKGNESKRVKVMFKVHKDGQVTNLRMLVSSGLAIADQAALKAIENAAPFRPLPDGADDAVDIEFTFDYNVFNGGGKGTFRSY